MMKIEPCVGCGNEMVIDESASASQGKKVYRCVTCHKCRVEGMSGPPLEIREINETVEVDK